MGPKFGSAVASPPWDGAGLGTRVTTQNSVVQGQTTWIYVDGIKTVWDQLPCHRGEADL